MAEKVSLPLMRSRMEIVVPVFGVLPPIPGEIEICEMPVSVCSAPVTLLLAAEARTDSAPTLAGSEGLEADCSVVWPNASR